MRHLEISEHPIELTHAVEAVKQVVDASELQLDLNRFGRLHLFDEFLFLALIIFLLFACLLLFFCSELLIDLFGLFRRKFSFLLLLFSHIEKHLRSLLLLSLRWHSLAPKSIVVDVTEAKKETTKVVVVMRLKVESGC